LNGRNTQKGVYDHLVFVCWGMPCYFPLLTKLITQSTDELIWMSHAQCDGDIWVIGVRCCFLDGRNIRENIAVPTCRGERKRLDLWNADGEGSVHYSCSTF